MHQGALKDKMVIDAASFYGKRKNENSVVDSSIAKYESLKKIKSISNPQTIIKEKKFYKQREAFSYYEDLKKRLRKERSNKECFNNECSNKKGSSKEIIIYTEELDNSKRCFIVDSFCSFLQFYCFYALNLDSVYFKEKQKKPKKEETRKERQTIELLDWLENENSDGNENETVLENKNTCVKSEGTEERFRVKTETESNYGYKNEENRNVANEKVHVKSEAHDRKEDKRRESMNLYELIVTEEKRWLYFDIEYECNGENGENKETILFIFLVEFCLFVYKKFDIKLNLIDFLILDSSSEHKVSFHVIIKNIHSVPCDYFQHLVDYCHFFLNETKLSENHFYKKYKQMTKVKKEEESTEKNYLLFDNEEVIKRFVELFINSIINKINETENIYLFKSHSICLDLHRNGSGSFDKEGFDFNKDESLSITTPTARDSQGGDVHKRFVCSAYSNSSSSTSTSTSRKSSTCDRGDTSAPTKSIIGVDEKNTRMKEEASKRKHVNETLKSQYFEICKHSLKDVVEYYINRLLRNSENGKKYNYIILLYAVKKRDIGNRSKGKDEEEEKTAIGKSLAPGGEKREEKKTKQNSDLSKIEKGMDENISDEDMKREIEWLMKDGTDFLGTYDHEHETNSEERFVLQCVIDSSVYSKNRNFRLIFSTKKNKENMLLLSPINVKKYDKKKINDVILRSLITFYKYEDVKYQIKKERIYKYKEAEEVYRYHVLKIPNQGVRIYKKRVVNNDRKCKIINYENLNDVYLNAILKIIFFWNFLLYKNFKKNKKYITTFRWEIEKEYFYKIIAIYNNFNFKKYEDYWNCYLEKSERKELDSPLKANGGLIKSEKGNTDVINNYLDNFDKLFLGNKDFFQDVLKLYKKYFNLGEGEEEDHRIFFVRYFLYSVTFKDNEYTLFFRDNKYCRNKNFSHKSNHIYLIYNIRYNLFIQKCYDDDCKHFVSDIFQF